MAQVLLSQVDIEQPSVVEPPRLQENEDIDAKPRSLKKKVGKSKKKKRKGNVHEDDDDDTQARVTGLGKP
jgi:hypothetical protein